MGFQCTHSHLDQRGPPYSAETHSGCRVGTEPRVEENADAVPGP